MDKGTTILNTRWKHKCSDFSSATFISKNILTFPIWTVHSNNKRSDFSSAIFPPISESKFSHFSSTILTFWEQIFRFCHIFHQHHFYSSLKTLKNTCLDFPSASFHPPRKANSQNFLMKYSLFWKQILRFVTFFINNTCFLKQTHTFCISTIYLI